MPTGFSHGARRRSAADEVHAIVRQLRCAEIMHPAVVYLAVLRTAENWDDGVVGTLVFPDETPPIFGITKAVARRFLAEHRPPGRA